MVSTRRWWRVCVSVWAAAATTAQAQAPDSLWHGNISLGGTATAGNSKTSVLNTQGTADKVSLIDKLSLRGTLNYGRAEVNGINQTTANLALGTGRYDHNLTPAVFAFGGLELETNRAANTARRATGTVGLGYHLLRDDRNTWDLFGGVGHTYLKANDGAETSGPQGLVGEESSHKLGDNSTFKQRLSLQPSSEVGDRATFDTGLSTAILGGWTLNTNLAVRYFSKVAPGTLKADTLWTVGFGYKY